MTVDEVTSTGAVSLVLFHMFNVTLSADKLGTDVSVPNKLLTSQVPSLLYFFTKLSQF